MTNTVPPMCWDAILKTLAIPILEIDKGLYNLYSALEEEISAVVEMVWIVWEKFSLFKIAL